MFDIVFDMDGTLVDSAAQCETIIDAMPTRTPAGPGLAGRSRG